MIQDQICKMEERKRIEDLENKILELDKSLTSFQQKEFLEYWGVLLEELESRDYSFQEKTSVLEGMKLKMISLNKYDSHSNYDDFSIDELKLRCLLTCKYAYRGVVRNEYLYHFNYDFYLFNGSLYAKFDKYGLYLKIVPNSFHVSKWKVHENKQWYDLKKLKSKINYKKNYEFKTRVNNGLFSVATSLGMWLIILICFIILWLISSLIFGNNSIIGGAIDQFISFIFEWATPLSSTNNLVYVNSVGVNKLIIFYSIFISLFFTLGYRSNKRLIAGLFR